MIYLSMLIDLDINKYDLCFFFYNVYIILFSLSNMIFVVLIFN